MNKKDRKIGLKKFVNTWVGIGFGVLFLYLACIGIDLDKIILNLESLNWFPLFLIIILRIIALVLRGFRWQAVLEHEKKISPFRLFRIASIGEMGNYLLPARLGEVIRVFILAKKEKISKSTSLGSVFADRFLDFLMVGIIFFVLINFIEIPDNIKQIAITGSVYLIGTILGFLIIFFLIKKIFQVKFSSYPKYLERINQILTRFSHSLKGLQNPKTLLKALLISLIIWFINIISLHLVILSLNLELAWYYSGMTIVIIALGMIIPSAPGYVGTYEFFCVSSLTYFSIEKSSALACALVSHGLLYISIVLTGLFCYMVEIIHMKRLKILQEIKTKIISADKIKMR